TSEYQVPQGLRYLNRGLEALALGGAEFEASIQEDWWWLRKSPPGVLAWGPPYSLWCVALPGGAAAVVFSVPPLTSRAGWFLAVDEHPDIFRVASHVAGAAVALLDSPWTGPTSPADAFWLIKKEYDLAPDVMRLLSVNVNQQFAYAPIAAEVVDENTIRFDYADPIATGAVAQRVEYEYLFRPPELTNASGEEPVVPRQWRRLIVDAAVYFLFYDKNDNRTESTGLLLIGGLKAMRRENRHKDAVQNSELGRLRPRQDDAGWPLNEFQVLRPGTPYGRNSGHKYAQVFRQSQAHANFPF